MPTLFITGANRGIGLELTRLYLEKGWSVLATCRDPQSAPELESLAQTHPKQLEVHALSVTDYGGVSRLAERLQGRSVDLLINNAGVRRMDGYHLGKVDPEAFRDSMEVNVLGALKVSEAFLPHLGGGEEPLLVMVSSSLGSIEKNLQGGDYAYRASKAALNAVMRSMAADLREKGVRVISLHPGWVRTGMGGGKAPLSPQESARAMAQVLEALGPEDTGRFLRFDGQEELW